MNGIRSEDFGLVAEHACSYVSSENELGSAAGVTARFNGVGIRGVSPVVHGPMQPIVHHAHFFPITGTPFRHLASLIPRFVLAFRR